MNPRFTFTWLLAMAPVAASADAAVDGHYRDTYVKGGVFELPKDEQSRSAFEFVPVRPTTEQTGSRGVPRKAVLYPGKFSKSTRGVREHDMPESTVWEPKSTRDIDTPQR